MLYLIGLGLNADSLTKEAMELCKRCKKIYLENYTIDLPYAVQHLEEILGKKINGANREFVESLSIVDEARKLDIALLVYGNPLMATTHITIVDECIKSNVKYRVLHNASVLDGVSETGLQIYKFGKITSMPRWDARKNFTPDSFIEVVKENQSIDAHSLILVDIGLSFESALDELEKTIAKHKIPLTKIIVCQQLGTRGQKIIFCHPSQLTEFKNIHPPFCFIIPGKLHFIEKEFLENFKPEQNLY
ncbi:diphthine synthase [Candidatus Pacearchaeota archaeon]|nr:diphthine synthase [Candidatus Pacearchaeota archaeon]